MLTDALGSFVPIAQPGWVEYGMDIVLANFERHVPKGRIRFNLRAVTTIRGFTFYELQRICHSPILRERTMFYNMQQELSVEAVNTMVDALGVV